MNKRPAEFYEADQLNDLICRARGAIGYDQANNDHFKKNFGLTPEYIQDPNNSVTVYILNGEIIAVISLKYFRNRHAELDHFFLEPKYHKQGYGRILWQELCAMAIAQGVEDFWFIANPHAKGFYIRMGAHFKEVYQPEADQGMEIMTHVLQPDFVKDYLRRIGFTQPVTLDLACLTELQKCHVANVPFETIDIYLQQQSHLTPTALANKIIYEQRGGYCYELNYLFSLLLKDLGFTIELRKAKLCEHHDSAHLVIWVTLAGQHYSVDVGWGNAYLPPTICENSPVITLAYEHKPLYYFPNEPVTIQSVTTRHHYHGNNPNSLFQKTLTCSTVTPSTYKLLTNLTYSETHNQKLVIQQVLKSPTELAELLADKFNIHLAYAMLQKLWQKSKLALIPHIDQN